MIKYVMITMLIIIVNSHGYYNGNLGVALRMQKTTGWYWDNGLEVSFSHTRFWDQRLHFHLSYLDSRLGSTFNNNGFDQQFYIIGTKILFRPFKLFRPVLFFNTGYYTYEHGVDLSNERIEGSEFTNFKTKSLLMSAGFGFQFNFLKNYGINLETGHQFIIDAEHLFPNYVNINLIYNWALDV